MREYSYEEMMFIRLYGGDVEEGLAAYQKNLKTGNVVFIKKSAKEFFTERLQAEKPLAE